MSSSPFFHWMLGVGYPETEHSSTTSVPSRAVTLEGRWRNWRLLGRPGSEQQKNSFLEVFFLTFDRGLFRDAVMSCDNCTQKFQKFELKPPSVQEKEEIFGFYLPPSKTRAITREVLCPVVIKFKYNESYQQIHSKDSDSPQQNLLSSKNIDMFLSH